MVLIWKCDTCGKPADYKSGKEFFCLEHWEIHLGHKDTIESRNRADGYETGVPGSKPPKNANEGQ